MELVSAAIAAEDAERRALERSLHDGLLQRLVALAVGLQLVRPALESRAEATALLDELRRDIDDALVDARGLADRLYPSLIDDQGLVHALRASAAAGPVVTRVDGALDGRLSSQTALTVHRCCAAALRAVSGDGARATVNVRTAGDLVEFEVNVEGGEIAAGSLEPLAARVEALGGALDAGTRRVAGRLPAAS